MRIAVALARPAHGPQTSDDGMLEPDQPPPLLVGLVLIADTAKLHGLNDGVEGRLGDRDADH
jgi:hypothetical protein